MYLDLTAPNQKQTGFLQTLYIYICAFMCISLDDDVISFVRDWSFNKTFDYSLKGLFMRQDEKSYWGGSLPGYGLSTGFFYHICKVNQC